MPLQRLLKQKSPLCSFNIYFVWQWHTEEKKCTEGWFSVSIVDYRDLKWATTKNKALACNNMQTIHKPMLQQVKPTRSISHLSLRKKYLFLLLSYTNVVENLTLKICQGLVRKSGKLPSPHYGSRNQVQACSSANLLSHIPFIHIICWQCRFHSAFTYRMRAWCWWQLCPCFKWE